MLFLNRKTAVSVNTHSTIYRCLPMAHHITFKRENSEAVNTQCSVYGGDESPTISLLHLFHMYVENNSRRRRRINEVDVVCSIVG